MTDTAPPPPPPWPNPHDRPAGFDRPLSPRPPTPARAEAPSPPPAPPAPFVPRPGLLDDAGRLCVSAMCRACHYNLRGLLPDSTCPECGHRVAPSLEADLLSFADHDWLVTLARGLRWLRAGVGCLIGLIVVAVVLSPATVFLTMIPRMGALMGPAMAVTGFALLLAPPLCCGLLARAAWLPATAEPARHEPDHVRIAREGVRFAVVALLIMLASAIALSGARPSATTVVAYITVGLVLLAIGQIALFHLLGRLARRIPDEPTRRQAKRAHGFAVALLVAVLIVAITALLLPDPLLMVALGGLLVVLQIVGTAELTLRLSHGLIRRLDELIAVQRHSTPPE
jgi:hypothetical protein